MASSTCVFLWSLALCAAAGSAQADGPRTAPGLWEVITKIGGDPELTSALAELQKQTAALPPDQRKEMQKMFKQQGLSISSEGQVSIMECITPAMAKRGQLSRQLDGVCTTKLVSSSASATKASFVCTDPVMSGEINYAFNDDKAYTANVVIETADKGATSRTTIASQSKWLSADCGQVEPVAQPKK